MKHALAAASFAIVSTMPLATALAAPAPVTVAAQQTPPTAADIRARLQQAMDQLD